MSKYTYTLRDYHAIKEAEIKLDGITVLSGINGCGKSTLSRWLYYLVNGSARFEEFEYSLYKELIINDLFVLEGFFNQIESRLMFGLHIKTEYYSVNVGKIKRDIAEIYYTPGDLEQNCEKIKNIYLNILSYIGRGLLEYLEHEPDIAQKNRIFSLFGCDINQDNKQGLITKVIEKRANKINDITEDLFSRINQRSKGDFFRLIEKNFVEKLNDDSHIQILEDDVAIIGETYLSKIFNLNKAIYIDTPMAVTSYNTQNIFWSDLQYKLISDNSDKANYLKLLLRIKRILEGETVLNKDELSQRKNLHFVSSDNKINILLKDVATGYKSFSYIQRLLENGELTSETLLMIDEPEAHLHPQWIVEFARILVMLHKEIGVKIMIASHNPDMISAIQAIAEASGVIENTNFYLAEPYEGNPHQYVYRCLGQDIEDIFKSFNVAFDKINMYANLKQ